MHTYQILITADNGYTAQRFRIKQDGNGYWVPVDQKPDVYRTVAYGKEVPLYPPGRK
jgi:hypothetical protein